MNTSYTNFPYTDSRKSHAVSCKKLIAYHIIGCRYGHFFANRGVRVVRPACTRCVVAVGYCCRHTRSVSCGADFGRALGTAYTRYGQRIKRSIISTAHARLEYNNNNIIRSRSSYVDSIRAATAHHRTDPCPSAHPAAEIELDLGPCVFYARIIALRAVRRVRK